LELFLSRRAGIPVRDQLIVQLELRILDGTLVAGSKLPSVRALARRLKIHANTVSAAYRALEATGRVRLRRGSGVYVVERGPAAMHEGRSLDEMIRLALLAAFRAGYDGEQIREAVERWLQASPPDRIVVVDRRIDVAELLAAELRSVLTPEIPAAPTPKRWRTPPSSRVRWCWRCPTRWRSCGRGSPTSPWCRSTSSSRPRPGARSSRSPRARSS
jgi:DNA-binding transcriptional regulator YhcF (GntR family)